jgi:hypothetical protein
MRRPDWLERLWQTIEAAERRSVVYGSFGCVQFVAQCLDVMTDSAWAPHVSEICADKHAAFRLLLRSGGLDELVSARLGTAVPRNLARRGDVVSIDLDRGPAVGMCIGERVVIAALPSGVDFRPLAQAHCAWRVD